MKTKKYLVLSLLVSALALAFPLRANAADLNADLNSDNHYQFYISTNNSVLGTFIGQSNLWGVADSGFPPFDWQDAEAFHNLALTPDVINYIHIVGVDDTGLIAGVLGSFDLTNPNFLFDNGTSHLITDTTAAWTAYIDSFGGTTTPIVSNGTNGDAPWGSFGTIDSSAQWIWTNQNAQGDLHSTRYFSARINPVVTPEPISSALFLFGGSALAAKRLRKKKAAL